MTAELIGRLPGAPGEAALDEHVGAGRQARQEHRSWTSQVIVEVLGLTGVLAVAAFLRFWNLAAVGFNSDEAVYAGTGATMAGDRQLSGMFPVFRAHPLLMQTLVSLAYRVRVGDWTGRAVAAGIGVAAVAATVLLGRQLYGRRAGLIAGLILALMPYHVIVSRQVLLDGLVVPFATLALYAVSRYCQGPSRRWMVAAGGMLGLAVLSKETALVLLGGLYAFFATSRVVQIKWRHLLLGLGALGAVVAAFPLAMELSHRAQTGGSYFLWQISRRPNHPMTFYLDSIPPALGWGVVLAAAVSLVVVRRRTWRELLLVWWVSVPAVVLTLWSVKGYQYLVPVAPAVAVLAGQALSRLTRRRWPWMAGSGRLRVVAPPLMGALLTVAVAVSLIVPTWQGIQPSTSGTFLAGTGGVPGGREAGLWIRDHTPQGSQLLTVGPSMANILQFYGGHRAYALSVSANPRARNPAYPPVDNADLWVRTGRVQYLVWDSYSQARTRFFTDKVVRLVHKYHGVAVFTATVGADKDGGAVRKPVVVVYQVWSS